MAKKKKSNVKSKLTNTKGEKVTVFKDGSKTRSGGVSSLTSRLEEVKNQAQGMGIDVSKANAMLDQTKKEGVKPFRGSSFEKKFKEENPNYMGTPMITSQMGKNIVRGADETIANLSPVTAQPEQPTSQQGSATQPSVTTPETPTAPPTESKDFLTYINPTTGQEQTLRGTAITDANQKALETQGYQLGIGDTSAPADTPEIAQAKADLATADSAVNSYMTKLTSMLVSDKELASEVRSISQGYKARVQEAKEITDRRTKTIQTLATRLGARYTGGSGGIMGSIIAEEERQGLQRIEAIENDKQDAILEAKKAAKEQNFSLYAQLAQRAEKIQEKKASELKTLKENQAKQDALIAAEKQKAIYDSLIAEELANGTRDPLELYMNLKGQVPYDVVAEMAKIMPDNKPVVLGKSDTLVDPKTGKIIARGVGEAVKKTVSITPIGTPSIAGLGASYDESSIEAQLTINDILNKLPVQLKNSEKEVELQKESIRMQLAAGYTYQQIVDRISGFSLQANADKDLGNALYDAALGTDVEAGALASMLNRGANEQAMTTVENSKLSEADGFFTTTDKARSTIKQADTVLSILNDPDFPQEALGAFDGRKFKVEKFLGLNDKQTKKVQELETALQLLASPIRVEVAGTAATESEMGKISAFQADILSQPDIIKTQVESLRDSVVGFHNEARMQQGLPEVEKDQIIDNKKRLDAYRGAKKLQEEAIVSGWGNVDFLNRGAWAMGENANSTTQISNSDFYKNY